LDHPASREMTQDLAGARFREIGHQPFDFLRRIMKPPFREDAGDLPKRGKLGAPAIDPVIRGGVRRVYTKPLDDRNASADDARSGSDAAPTWSSRPVATRRRKSRPARQAVAESSWRQNRRRPRRSLVDTRRAA